MKILLALSSLCCLGLATCDAGVAAAGAHRKPIRMSMVRMRMQMDAEERANRKLHFDVTGGRALKCRRSGRVTALCSAGYWGYSELPAGRDGSKSYRHRDCTERVRWLTETEDWGGFFPLPTVLERPRCVEYESARPSSPLWDVVDYAHTYAAELAASLPYEETSWKVSNCWRPSFPKGECDIGYSGSAPVAPNGATEKKCIAEVKGKFAPSGRIESASVGNKHCVSVIVYR